MKAIIKKTLDRFIICFTVILTFFLILFGKVTAEQNGTAVFTGEKYEQVMLKNNESSIEFRTDEKTVKIDKAFLETFKEYEEYIPVFPFGAFSSAAENLQKLYKALKGV